MTGDEGEKKKKSRRGGERKRVMGKAEREGGRGREGGGGRCVKIK